MPQLFNGSHTLQNRETGEHRTFRVRTVRQGALEGKRVIGLLSGPDNTSDYTNFGFVTEEGITVWRKHRGGEKRSAYEWYAIMLWEVAVKQNPEWTGKYDWLLEGRCCRCNRKLTHPDSLRTGVGPECGGRK
jgi:hypothetical protein